MKNIFLYRKKSCNEMATKGLVQQAVWRKRRCCLVGHLAGFWKFPSRPSLTDTPACPKLLKRYMQGGTVRTWQEKVEIKLYLCKKVLDEDKT